MATGSHGGGAGNPSPRRHVGGEGTIEAAFAFANRTALEAASGRLPAVKQPRKLSVKRKR